MYESNHTYVNESWHIYEFVVSHMNRRSTEEQHRLHYSQSFKSCPHIWMRHVTRMNESCRSQQQHKVHYAQSFESCHTYECVKSHMWMCHAACNTCECVMLQSTATRAALSSHTTDGGDRTWNNYDCQNFKRVFTGVPVHIKHVLTEVPKFSSKFSRE